MPDVSIVICAYNEQENISAVVNEAVEVLDRIASRYEIICVNDGSDDQTGIILDELAKKNPSIIVLNHSHNQGIGKSLKDGYKAAKYEFISWLAGDGQNSPLDLKLFVDAAQDVDFVVSYYRKRPDPFIRIFMSKIVRSLLFILYGPLPRTEGPYMFRRAMLERINLISDSFVLNFEFIIKACWSNFKYRKVQVECYPRIKGVSKVANLKTILTVLQELIKLRIKLLFDF